MNESNKKSLLHEFRNTLVRLRVLEEGKPCGRFYHNLRKYYKLTTSKDKQFERNYKKKSSTNKKVR